MKWRRFLDWPDWIHPEAWALEHNKNHHCHLNEYVDFDNSDPDLVESNMQSITNLDLGLGMPWLNIAVKDVILLANILFWRWSYYASNTYDRLLMSKLPKEERLKLSPGRTMTVLSLVRSETCWEYLSIVMKVHVPNMIYWLIFCVIYERFLWQGSFYRVLRNVMIGEMFANIHSFMIIVPNHCGGDMYKFPTPAKGQVDIIFRSVLGSVNYDLGNYWVDFFSGYLNYQIEHHMFPDASPLHYRALAPKVKAICHKYEIPYIQEHVLWRVFHTRQIVQGFERMMVFDDSASTSKASDGGASSPSSTVEVTHFSDSDETCCSDATK
jgi:fatty acid desaturase